MRCEKQNSMLLKSNRVGVLSVFLRDNKKDDCKEVYCLGVFSYLQSFFYRAKCTKRCAHSLSIKMKIQQNESYPTVCYGIKTKKYH